MNVLLSRLPARIFPVLIVILSFAWPGSGRAASESTAKPPLSEIYQAGIASPIRTAEDREADARRKPLDFLQLTRVQPGMHVLDVAAGGGYTTQLLALAVGSAGTVWAQGPSISPGLKDRLATHPQKNIVPVALPFDNPAPADVANLDLVTIIYNYHDIAYMPVDRKEMDRKLFSALKPGGYLVVIDHAAKAGTGIADAKTLHRIDEATVKKEFQQAGFRLDEESNAFRNPADPLDQPFFKMNMATDSFALRFIKP